MSVPIISETRKIRTESELRQFLGQKKKLSAEVHENFGETRVQFKQGVNAVARKGVQGNFSEGELVRAISTGYNVKGETGFQAEALIRIYRPSKIFMQQKQLARAYTSYGDDLHAVCIKNATLCLNDQRPDLFRAWNILGCSLKDLDTNIEKLKEWKHAPLGKRTFLYILSNFLK